jgi:hypothetical protein
MGSTNVTSKLCPIDPLLELLRDQMVMDAPKEELSMVSLDPSAKAACTMIVRLAISSSEDVLPKIISSSIRASAKIELLLEQFLPTMEEEIMAPQATLLQNHC